MDNKLFNERLSQIAEWYIPIVTDGNQLSRKPMPDSRPNKSMGLIIEQLKPQLSVCTACGQICSQRCTHTWTVNHLGQKLKKPKWTHHCQTCKRNIDPLTLKVIEKNPTLLEKAIKSEQKNTDTEGQNK